MTLANLNRNVNGTDTTCKLSTQDLISVGKLRESKVVEFLVCLTRKPYCE